VIHFAIDFSADGDRLYIGEYGNELTLHDFRTEREIEFGGVNGGYFAFSPDGKQVVVNNRANKRGLVVCDVETTRPVITLLEGAGKVDWSSDGKRIAAMVGNELNIWTLPPRP
jgi:DNA-binding beta-propeller fold protein YncE